MRIPASLSFFKLIAIKYDKVLLFILVYLTKYITYIYFKSINLHLKCYLLVIIF